MDESAQEYRLFASFSLREQAKDIVDLLNENGIQYKWNDNNHEIISGIIGSTTPTDKSQLLLLEKDFNKVETLLKLHNLESELSDDYYLHNFNYEELTEVVMKPDQWGAIDYELAKKLLKQQNADLDDDWFQLQKKHRIAQLKKPDRSNPLIIYAGYLLALLGGIFGVFIGHSIWNGKKTIFNGEQVFRYREEDRLHGKRIVITGTILLIIYIALRLIVGLNLPT